jgi:hypothetical protein
VNRRLLAGFPLPSPDCSALPSLQVALTEALDQVYDMGKKEITITF